MTGRVVLVTGASSGFGRLTAEALARRGEVVYASIRDIEGRNRVAAAAFVECARRQRVELRPIELDVSSEASCNAAAAALLAERGRIDVVVHNAGHMATGPAEAFTTEQFAALYDVNVLGAQRVCRAFLPAMRARREGLLVWVSSSSVAGGTPPYLAPYFAAKAAMDALAVQYARELARWGIETSIVVPGAFRQGTQHFAHADAPEDAVRAGEYEAGANAGLAAAIDSAFASLVPADADAGTVAEAIVAVVAAARGDRPFRVHVDPSNDGASVAFAVIDRVRAEMLRRVGLADLLVPRVPAAASSS